jgi:hypothetical protein
MIVLNFSHPLLPEQQAQIESLAGGKIEKVLLAPVEFDNQQPFLPQLQATLERLPLSAQEWQTQPLLVVLPAYNYIAALLLAEFHGRAGYFPTIVRLRPVAGELATRFEVAELINLQAVREQARRLRQGGTGDRFNGGAIEG